MCVVFVLVVDAKEEAGEFWERDLGKKVFEVAFKNVERFLPVFLSRIPRFPEEIFYGV